MVKLVNPCGLAIYRGFPKLCGKTICGCTVDSAAAEPPAKHQLELPDSVVIESAEAWAVLTFEDFNQTKIEFFEGSC